MLEKPSSLQNKDIKLVFDILDFITNTSCSPKPHGSILWSFGLCYSQDKS